MVETFRQREVQTSGQVPGYQNVQYSPDAFGAQVGRAMQQLGQTTSNVGALVSAMDDEKKANDALTFANKAKDELRPILFDHEFGVYAQQGGNAMGGGATANAALDNIRKKYLKQIDDPKTKEAFEKLWLREEEQTKDTVSRHEMSQLGNYKVETTKATLLSSMQDAYNSYNDPKAIEHAITASKTAIRANTLGLPEGAMAAAEAEATSQIHLAVISRFAAEDPTAALDYYTKNKDSLSGKDHVTATSFVDAARTNRKAYENAAQLTGTSTAATNLYSAIEFAESTGNPNVESAAGASGLMQLMPETAREVALSLGRRDIAELPEAELKRVLKEDTTLNRRLGQTYFNTQLKTYNNDIEAALVAYNAGPKWANEFLKHNAGKPPGQRSYDVPGNKKLKSETEPYVQKVLSRAGMPQNQTPAGYRLTRDNWDLKNFQPQDLMAPTGGGQWVDARAARGLDSLQDRLSARFPGLRIKINEDHDFSTAGGTAGKRRGTSDPNDNPHVEKSQHVAGTAFDVQTQGWSPEQKAAFISEARALGFKGFGFYGDDGHLHIDMGNERSWGGVPDWAAEAMKTPVGSAGPGVQVASADGGFPAGGLPTTAGGTYYGVGAAQPGAFGNSGIFDLESALNQAQLIADPTERERTMSLLRSQHAVATQGQAQEAAAVKQHAWDTVIQGAVKDLTPDILARLEPSFVNSLYAYEEKKNQGGVTQDWAAWATIPVDDKELASLDVYTEYRNKLDDAHFDKVVAMQREALKKVQGQQHDSKLLSNARTYTQIISDIASEQGWSTKNDKGNKAIAAFSRKMDERILGEQATLERELSATEIQDIADKLLIADQYDSWGWDSSRNAMTTDKPDEFVAATEWDEVQQDDQSTLIQSYKQFYQSEPDRETATDLYNRALRVWLGGTPDGPEEEQLRLRTSLEAQLNRTLTETEFKDYYGRYLLKFLGR